MTGPTHRQYSIGFAYIAMMIIYGIGISEINYYLALPIMLVMSKAGAAFPDVDHIWQNVSDKTTLNKIINTIIHITGGKHRSWQTHSIDICVLFTVASVIVPRKLLEYEVVSKINMQVLSIILLGFAAGWISHIFSDMLTSAGVRLICFLKFKIKLVPKKIGKLRFNTGNEWEAFNYKVVKILNIFLAISCLIYPLIMNGTLTNLINSIRG